MTTVEYGGGANLQQRKEFCELDDGAKIPGYKGYCPSLKFTFGKTFAKSTRDISSETKKDYNNNNNTNVYSRTTAKQQHQQQLHYTNVPENNGRNKYSKDMVSGYTGFIPKCSTKFGKTYREECEKCFSEHFHDLELYKDRRNRDKLTSQQTSGLQVPHRRNKEEILRSLNEYTNGLTLNANGKKPLIEAPIMGYTGFVPKKNTTELGLGASYGRAAEKSLEKFDLETNAYKNKIAFLENNVTCCCRYK